jgi:signal transduction histidine kinase
MPLLVGLLVVTFAIAADLAHEAWSNALSRQRTAERAGRDLVRYTATSTAYETRTALDHALHALFAPNATRTSGDRADVGVERLIRSAAHVRDCKCAPAITAHYYFQLRLSDRALQLKGASEPSMAERQWLADTVAARARSVWRSDWDYALVSGVVDGQRRIVGYAPNRDGGDSSVYGFVSDVAALREALSTPRPRTSTRREPDAAASANLDTLLRTSVLAEDGTPLYDADARQPELRVTMVPRAGHESYAPGVAPVASVTLFADTVPLGPRYADLRLAVALAPSEPGALAGGELPRSRLFALFGLLVLMGGLVVAAVLQLRREHELAKLRADLTAGVSHELRTPLAQILLFGETLMFERTRSERERRAAAEIIVRETRRLMHLVENALHFTRADRALLELTPEPIDLGVATREILVSFAPLAWAANVTLREVIDEPVAALIDASAYRQIVLNLLENAVHYGPAGQTIVIRLERTRDMARLIVDDEGPGVPFADRERIFAPFVRLTSQRRGGGGTGIGLAVVRDLTTRHGGQTWVERSERGGARFVVALPAAPGSGKDSGRDGFPPAHRAAF